MSMCRAQYAKELDTALFPGIQGGPLMHVIAAKAVAFKEALEPDFKRYQEQIVKNCRALAEELVGHGFRLVSGGTDVHLLLVDLRSKKITGKTAQHALEKAGITVNKNTIPFDPEKPMVTSGIRIGTPALTTRGMKEEQMRTIGKWIAEVLNAPENDTVARDVLAKVGGMSKEFPLYASRLK
jgi:glycine hydroxymethyltransferase